MAVLPDYRMQGVGRRLVEHAMRALEEEGILKPIDFDELRAALKKVSAHLDAARQTSRRSDEQIALFLTYVLAGLYTSPTELRRLATMIHFPFSIDGTLCRVLDIAPESVGEWDSESLIKLIESTFRAIGGEMCA